VSRAPYKAGRKRSPEGELNSSQASKGTLVRFFSQSRPKSSNYSTKVLVLGA
jgi:hypothetical protein